MFFLERTRRKKHQCRGMLIVSVAAFCFLLSSNTFAAPSRAFIQELGRISSPGNIYIDLYNNTGTWTAPAGSQARFGTRYGEVILEENGMGGKFSLARNIVLYGIGRLSVSSSESSYAEVGAAYQIRTRIAFINLNPIVKRNTSGNIVVNFATAFFTPLRIPGGIGNVQLGGEFQTPENSGDHSAIAVGFRWLPKDFITADIVLLGDGGTMQTTTVRTPAALRLNVRF